MALAKTIKINLTGLQKNQNEILESLHNSGSVQIDNINVENQEKNYTDTSEIDYKIAGIKFAIEFLSQFDNAKKSFAEKINNKIELNNLKLNEVIRNFDQDIIVKAVQETENKINQAQNQIEKAKIEIENLTPWKTLDFAPNQGQMPKGFAFKLVKINELRYPTLLAALTKDLPLAEIQQIKNENKEISSVVIYKKEQENILNEITNRTETQSIEISELDVKVSERIKILNSEIQGNEKEIKDTNIIAKNLLKELPNLKITSDYLQWQKEQLSQNQKAIYSQKTFTLTGWMDQRNFKTIQKKLEKITDNFILEEIEIKEDDAVPGIYNNKISEPFEMVTGLYGTPQQNEPDPTPFLAPFFTLFFGMAMTDAGYGLVMALLIILAIKFLKIPREKQKLLRVLIWGGVATFALGALTGGWFSIDLNTLPASIAAPLQAIQLVNPIENPLVIFYISLGLGVFQVLFGLGIDLWWKLTHKQAKEGIMTSGAWMLTLISLITMSAAKFGFLSAGIGNIFKYLTFLGLAMIVLKGMSGTKNIFLKPGLGALKLYDIVGYFSDVLSYSRLLALGLTTGIIGMVVNIIAGLVAGIPYVGWLVALVVLVGGHLFNLIINALGAFIHSGRLQFIEFFPKFMEAGGELFQPFRKENKYIKIIN